MKFQEAKAKLKKMAKGEYHTLTYDLTEHSDGLQKAECTVYITGATHCSGPTWADALRKMEVAIETGGKPIVEEMPGEEGE